MENLENEGKYNKNGEPFIAKNESSAVSIPTIEYSNVARLSADIRNSEP
jgi:hypothetical protein